MHSISCALCQRTHARNILPGQCGSHGKLWLLNLMVKTNFFEKAAVSLSFFTFKRKAFAKQVKDHFAFFAQRD